MHTFLGFNGKREAGNCSKTHFHQPAWWQCIDAHVRHEELRRVSSLRERFDVEGGLPQLAMEAQLVRVIRPAPRQERRHLGAGRATRRAAIAAKSDEGEEGASTDDEGMGLEPWQERELQRALARGRRNFSVLSVCKRAKLPRRTVLEWVRRNQGRVEVEQRGNQERGRERERSKKPKEERVGGRRLTRPQRETLERLWQETRWPSWEQLESVWQLTGLPKTVALSWFEERRRSSPPSLP